MSAAGFPAAAMSTTNRIDLAEIELPNSKLDLRPGMYAMVKMGIERKEDVLLVPTAAVVLEKANAFVFLPKEGKAKKTPVKIGFNDGTNTEILTGLRPEDPVLLPGARTLNDGQLIRAQEAK